MARYTAQTATGPGALDVFHQAFVAHLVANGWTQHDVISTTTGARDVVLRGQALDATADLRPFFRVTQSGTTVIVGIAYADWDTTTHAGIGQAGVAGTTSWTFQDATFNWYAWCDGFGGQWTAGIGANFPRGHWGFARRGLSSYESGITKTTSSLAIGATSLPVASDMTNKLKVGQKVLVMNYAHTSGSANAANCELVTISSISSSAIGISALTKAYDTGAVVGENIALSSVSGTSNTQTSIGGSTFFAYNADGTRTSNGGQSATHQTVSFGNEPDSDPGEILGKYASGPIVLTRQVASKSDWHGFARGVYAVSGGAQVFGDIMDDGTGFTYLVMGNNSTAVVCMGPREL